MKADGEAPTSYVKKFVFQIAVTYLLQIYHIYIVGVY